MEVEEMLRYDSDKIIEKRRCRKEERTGGRAELEEF